MIKLFGRLCTVLSCHALHSILCKIGSLLLAPTTVCKRHAAKAYAESISRACTALAAATDAFSLDHATQQLARLTRTPWASLDRPVPARFWSGLSRALDNAAKRRTALLRRDDDHSHRKAKVLDRYIKLEFRKAKRKLMDSLREDTKGTPPSRAAPLVKRLLHIQV